MPAQVNVNVQVNENGARQTLTELDALVNKLNGKKIKISVDVPAQQLNQINNIATGITGTGTAAITAASAITGYGEKVKSSITMVNGAVTKETAQFKKDAQTQIDVTRKLTKEGEQYTVKTTDNYEAIRKAGEKQWEAQQKLYAQQFAAFDKREKRQAEYQAEIDKATKAEADAAAKVAKAEQEAADKRLATYGRIAKVAATAFAIKETKEALSTMKDVDQELANIQKVTDESSEAIKKLGESAYDTASKYGVAATEYLSSAAEFAKAGYSNYAELSELAIKTQLVGDVSSDVAAKFLLSADAAYKFGGNVNSLTTVLDKANVIENNYATSIYKLAEGFPIVASTASMANMSIDELMAGLGTITATTQETGRKAATALRALILNIEGEIGTVIDEDMTITQESVESMSDALKKYGNEAVQAAQKTGQLVDPMEAIKSLAEAYKQGDLSDQGLFDILSSLGGKLRTNQLTAIVKNFDMFSEMLDKVKYSAGSADKEVATMLGTWNSKLNQLENTWTKFVSHILDSETIKGGIDLVKGTINGLDAVLSNPLGETAAKILATEAAVIKLSQAFELIKKSSFGVAIQKQIAETLGSVTGLTAAVEALKITFSTLNAVSLGTLIGELIALKGIIDKRGEINDDRFKYFYGQSAAEASSLGETVFNALETNSGNPIAQLSAVTDIVSRYTDVYNQLKDAIDSGANPEDFEREFGFSVTKFLSDYEKAQNAINNLNRIIDGSEEVTEELAEGFETVAKAADEAAKAIEAFGNATQTTKSAYSDAYRSAYQQFLEDYKAGKTDTNVVRAAADMFLPEEIQQALGYNLQAMGEVLASDLYQGIYNGASGNAGVDFVNYMANNMTDALDQIVNITEAADGTLSFEFASAEKLAEYFNLPLGAIQALIGALDEFGVQAGIGWEEADNLANALGLVGDNAGKSEITLEGIARSLKDDFGYSDKTDIAKIISALDIGGYLEGIIGEITPEAIGAAISAAFSEAEVTTEMENPPVVEPEVDTSQLEEANEKIKEIPDSQDKTVNIIVTGTEDIDSLKNWLETSPGTYNVIVNDDGSITVISANADALNDTLTALGEGTYAVAVSDDGTITVIDTEASNAEASLSKLENPVTVKVNEDGTISSVSGDANTLKETLTSIGELSGSSYTITINDPDNAETYKTTLESIEGVHDVTVKEDGSVQAKADAEALEEVLEKVEGDKPVTVTATVNGTEDTKALADEEDRITDKDVTIGADTTDGTANVGKLASAIATIQDKTVTITTLLRTVGSTSNKIASSMQDASSSWYNDVNVIGSGSAEGTKFAPGGVSLVNELGPELISDNGRAYIANGGKPAIVNLGRGAIVLTAEETRQALGNAAIYGGINAYKGGLANTPSGNKGTGASGIPGGGTKPQWQEYYIDPNEGKKLAEEAQEAAEAAAESWEAIEKRLKEELGLLNETAEYYHNFRDHVGEASTYREAIDKLQAAKRQLLDSGYDEMSSEVVSLTNQIFDYGEKFTDATRHFYEDLNEHLSDVIDSLDELAEWYHNQGRHEEEIGVYNAKIEELELAKQKLLESGYAETDKEVLELSNQIFDIEKDIADAKQHAYEEVVDNLDSILSGLEQLEEYYTNQGNFDKVVEVQKQQVAEVYDAIDQLLAQGYDELSTEVVSLLNQVFGLESEIQDAREYEYNKMIGDLEELLRYLDKLADYYHTIGDVDKEIETLERAKAETDAVKKKVKDLGYDELDEKVIDLAKSSYNYSEKIASAKAPSSSGGGSSKDDLNDILKKYDALANYYRNKKDYSSEEATIQEALNELIKRRDKLLKQGYAETSEKVVELANKIFEYEEKVLEARKRSIDDLKDQLSNLDSQIDIAKYQADSQRMIQLQREAQNKIAELIQKYREAGYSDTSDEILGLTKMGYGYAENESSEVKNLWKSLIDALEAMRDTQDDANDLAEKQLAVDEARIALEKAQTQRSVRVFNPVTGQWEWVANAKDIKQAEENLSRAEESLLEKQTSDELALLKQAMENGGSLSGVSIGPGLSALLSGASVEQTNAFATALGALSGGLGLVADTSAKSIFDSVDSHDNVTQYQFNGVSIDTGTAENTTLAELTRMITPLALTNNMPA